MKNLERLLLDYLSKPTDYAIQISGNWGSGKTYYYKNNLEKLIKKTPLYDNNKKNYKPIHISLFGLKSIEDISTKIVIEFYQSKLFKNYFKSSGTQKVIKITQSVLKIGLRGFLNFTRLGKLDDFSTDIKDASKNVLDSSELLICLDDLERKDSALNMEDLTGYINSLVDEEVKIVIISNEDLLISKGGEYKNLKEKIIGITIEYIPDVKETLLNIVEKRYAGFPEFKKFIIDNFELLIKTSRVIKNNFRHMIYALDCLQNCYSEIRTKIIDPQNEIHVYVSRELPLISSFILSFAIEFKSSNLKFSDISKYQRGFFFLEEAISSTRSTTNQDANTPKHEYDILIEKYELDKNTYMVYESIFNYVTGFDEFNVQLFETEFKKRYNLERGKIPIHYEVLNSLNYLECFDLTDEEYKVRTLQIIDYASEGLYSATEYITVMHYAERLNNLLDLNLIEVKDRLIEGLKRHLKNLHPEENVDSLRFEFSYSGDLSEYNKEIYKIGKEQIKIIEEKKAKERVEDYAKLLMQGTSEFKDRYQMDNDFRYQVTYSSFLNHLDPKELFEYIKKANGQTLHFLKFFFKERYSDSSRLFQEQVPINSLIDLMSDYNKNHAYSKENMIKNYLISELTAMLIKVKEDALLGSVGKNTA